MRKLLLSLGALTITVAPLASLISCNQPKESREWYNAVWIDTNPTLSKDSRVYKINKDYVVKQTLRAEYSHYEQNNQIYRVFEYTQLKVVEPGNSNYRPTHDYYALIDSFKEIK